MNIRSALLLVMEGTILLTTIKMNLGVLVVADGKSFDLKSQNHKGLACREVYVLAEKPEQ